MHSNTYSSTKLGADQSLRGAAAHFLDNCQSRGHVAFSLAELQAATGLSALAANRQLAHLTPLITRVTPRGDFFLIVGPECRDMGAPPVDWWLNTYCQFQQQPYYLGLLSAAAAHGVTPQAVQVTQVITDRPTRSIVLGRLRIEFFVKKRVTDTPSLEAPRAYAPLLVSTPEATALDLIAYAPRIGGIFRATQTIAGLIPRMTAGGLRRALAAERETPNKQRLGFILEALGQVELCRIVERSLPRQLKHILLQKQMPETPNTRKAGDPRWRVWDNITLDLALL